MLHLSVILIPRTNTILKNMEYCCYIVLLMRRTNTILIKKNFEYCCFPDPSYKLGLCLHSCCELCDVGPSLRLRRYRSNPVFKAVASSTSTALYSSVILFPSRFLGNVNKYVLGTLCLAGRCHPQWRGRCTPACLDRFHFVSRCVLLTSPMRLITALSAATSQTPI